MSTINPGLITGIEKLLRSYMYSSADKKKTILQLLVFN